MRRIILPLLMATTLLEANSKEPLKITLTSVQQNIHVDAWQMSGADITPEAPGQHLRTGCIGSSVGVKEGAGLAGHVGLNAESNKAQGLAKSTRRV